MRRLLSTEPVRLVLLSAPAGYGKTTLLQQWAQRDPRPFHWLPPGRAPRARARWSAQVAALAAAPQQLGCPWVLVVDDLDDATGPAAAELLLRLAAAVPPGCLLVVAGRAPGLLPAGRLRVEREVLELGPRDLVLTHGEAADAVAGLGAGRPSEAALDALLEATEGWPAALSLAAQAQAPAGAPAQARGTGAGLTAALAHDPFVAGYVRDEVLAGLPRDLRRFLVRCSILDDLEPERCDAVLAEPGASASLTELERSPLPIARAGRAEPRLRVHPLVRRVLLAELQLAEPAAVPALHRRASAWFAQRGDEEPAIRHAIAAGDLGGAGRLVWRAAQHGAWDGGHEALERWLAELPAHEAQRHEGLALAAAMRALARLDVADAERWLAVVAERPRPRGAPGRSLRSGRAVLGAALARDDLAAMRRTARHAAVEAPAGEPAEALAAMLDGAAASLLGERAAARDALEHAARRAAASAPGIAALAQAQLALVALCDGDWEHGATLAERARARTDTIGAEAHAALALVVAVSAFARAHRGRFAEAHLDAELALRLAPERDDLPPWYGAQLGLALARAQLRLSERDAGRRLLADARRAAGHLPEAHALHGWLDAADSAAGAAAPTEPAAEPLTAAELRVLRFLPSHLSFREIGGRLHVSANTIKSQAHAIYRKLGASSRSLAVDRARALGLLDAGITCSPGSEDAVGWGRP